MRNLLTVAGCIAGGIIIGLLLLELCFEIQIEQATQGRHRRPMPAFNQPVVDVAVD